MLEIRAFALTPNISQIFSYQEGPLGILKEGTYADLIIVNGNLLENLDLVADPDKNFAVIMKDGKEYKNTL